MYHYYKNYEASISFKIAIIEICTYMLNTKGINFIWSNDTHKTSFIKKINKLITDIELLIFIWKLI